MNGCYQHYIASESITWHGYTWTDDIVHKTSEMVGLQNLNFKVG